MSVTDKFSDGSKRSFVLLRNPESKRGEGRREGSSGSGYTSINAGGEDERRREVSSGTMRRK